MSSKSVFGLAANGGNAIFPQVGICAGEGCGGLAANGGIKAGAILFFLRFCNGGGGGTGRGGKEEVGLCGNGGIVGADSGEAAGASAAERWDGDGSCWGGGIGGDKIGGKGGSLGFGKGGILSCEVGLKIIEFFMKSEI